MKHTPTLVSLALVLVAHLFLGCSTSEWTAPDPDGGPAPGQDAIAPPPGQDAIAPPPPPPPPKQDAGTPPPPPPPPKQDAGTPPPPPPPPKQDAGTPPPPPKPLTNNVAAIQYASGQAAVVKAACTSDPLPDVCALKELVAQAVSKKASYVVLPEYGIDQPSYEPIPAIGDNPATDSAWPVDWVLTTFSKQAKQHNIYLFLNVITHQPNTTSCSSDTDCSGNGVCTKSGTCTNLYNTNIAYDNTGKVVGLHRKFNLFGGETQSLTAGTDVTVFQTPLGTMGMLICADIYGSTTLNNKLANTLQARVVMVSSYWTTSNPIGTYYNTYLGKYPYYSVIANTVDAPGYGGGVFKGAPWKPVASTTTPNPQVSTTPSIAVAPIPLP